MLFLKKKEQKLKINVTGNSSLLLLKYIQINKENVATFCKTDVFRDPAAYLSMV